MDAADITDVPLLPGERILGDFVGNTECCFIPVNQIDCCCCSKECGRLTDRRIIFQTNSLRSGLLQSSALLEDVTACSLGRARPKWGRILTLLLVGVVLVGVFSDLLLRWDYDCGYERNAYSSGYSKKSCDYPPVGWHIALWFGLALIGLAAWIYYARPTSIHYFVKGATDNDNAAFSLNMSRPAGLQFLGLYFATKTKTSSVPVVTHVGGMLGEGPTRGYASMPGPGQMPQLQQRMQFSSDGGTTLSESGYPSTSV